MAKSLVRCLKKGNSPRRSLLGTSVTFLGIGRNTDLDSGLGYPMIPEPRCNSVRSAQEIAFREITALYFNGIFTGTSSVSPRGPVGTRSDPDRRPRSWSRFWGFLRHLELPDPLNGSASRSFPVRPCRNRKVGKFPCFAVITVAMTTPLQ